MYWKGTQSLKITNQVHDYSSVGCHDSRLSEENKRRSCSWFVFTPGRAAMSWRNIVSFQMREGYNIYGDRKNNHRDRAVVSKAGLHFIFWASCVLWIYLRLGKRHRSILEAGWLKIFPELHPSYRVIGWPCPKWFGLSSPWFLAGHGKHKRFAVGDGKDSESKGQQFNWWSRCDVGEIGVVMFQCGSDSIDQTSWKNEIRSEGEVHLAHLSQVESRFLLVWDTLELDQGWSWLLVTFSSGVAKYSTFDV